MTWHKALKQIDATVRSEIGISHDIGIPWTPWREMMPYENIGKALCPGRKVGRKRPRRSPSCTRRASMISYCTALRGCVVSCTDCFLRGGKRG